VSQVIQPRNKVAVEELILQIPVKLFRLHDPPGNNEGNR
jgi:hypothetical protein